LILSSVKFFSQLFRNFTVEGFIRKAIKDMKIAVQSFDEAEKHM